MTVARWRPQLSISALGAVTPVGHTVEESCAAIRAGLAGMGEHPFFDVETPDPGWDPDEPLTAALVPDYDPLVEGGERLVELSLAALRELLGKARLRRSNLRSTALCVALPEADEVVRTWGLETVFVPSLCKRAGLPLFNQVRIDQSGHVAAFRLLCEADQLLQGQGVSRVILLAVDSWHDEARLDLCDKRYRLRSDRAVDGYIPGEAAVALLLEARPQQALATLGAIAAADEPHPYTSELSSSGRGLQQVIEATIGAEVPRWVVCDLNGESYRAYEWGLLRSRLAPRLDAPRLEHPADCVGDTGSATGALLLACATQAFVRGYARASEALLWTAADGPARMALSLVRPHTS